MVKEREGRPYVVDAMGENAWWTFRILGGFAEGFQALRDVVRAVTVFG